MKTTLSSVGKHLGLLAFSAFAFATGATAQVTYGLSFFENELFSVDPTGTGTLIGTVDMNVTGYGLAAHDGHLFTFDPNADRIRELSTSTAQVINSYDIGVGDLLGEGDLAFRSDGVGFLSTALAPDLNPTNDLYRFDISTGNSVRVGRTTLTLDGLAFVGDTLYGIAQEGDPSLYIVDQTTGSLTAVGSLGITAGSPFAALSAGADGRLYGVIDDRLYTIDAATGHAAVVNPTVLDLGFASVSGLAIMPAALGAVPEPSTYGAIGAALLLAIAGFRCRAQHRKGR